MSHKHHTISRFEFRTFAHDLKAIENVMKNLSDQVPEEFVYRKSEEVYFIDKNNTSLNCKIRENHLDVKILKEISDGFELWKPELSLPFPIKKEQLDNEVSFFLGKISGISNPVEYTPGLLIELMQIQKKFSVVKVAKIRHGYYVNNTICEYADVTINGLDFQTVCCESTDTNKLKKTAQILRLLTYENTSYTKAICQILDL